MQLAGPAASAEQVWPLEHDSPAVHSPPAHLSRLPPPSAEQRSVPGVEQGSPPPPPAAPLCPPEPALPELPPEPALAAGSPPVPAVSPPVAAVFAPLAPAPPESLVPASGPPSPVLGSTLMHCPAWSTLPCGQSTDEQWVVQASINAAATQRNCRGSSICEHP
jgi:hypothetical protein